MCNNKRCREHVTKKILSYFLDVSQTLARARFVNLAEMSQGQRLDEFTKKTSSFFSTAKSRSPKQKRTTVKTCERLSRATHEVLLRNLPSSNRISLFMFETKKKKGNRAK